MLNRKDMIINLIVGLIKMMLYKNEPLGGDINVTMDSSNYASKTYFKKMQQVLILLN